MNDRDQTKDRLSGESVADEGHQLLDGIEAFQKAFKGHGAVMYVVDMASFFIVDANEAALKFYGYDRATMLTKRIPDLNITPEKEIRTEIKKAVAEGRSYYVFKHRLSSGEVRDVEIYANPISIRGKDYSFSIVHDITERTKIEEERLNLITELQKALVEIKTLRGILPVCCICGLIRDDTGVEHGKGEWMKVDKFVVQRTDAQVSHSYCPKCHEKAMEDV